MTNQQRIIMFLPVMKELESMGYNPLKIMFQEGSFADIENTYIALTRAKAKYPKWYAIVSKEIGILQTKIIKRKLLTRLNRDS